MISRRLEARNFARLPQRGSQRRLKTERRQERTVPYTAPSSWCETSDRSVRPHHCRPPQHPPVQPHNRSDETDHRKRRRRGGHVSDEDSVVTRSMEQDRRLSAPRFGRAMASRSQSTPTRKIRFRCICVKSPSISISGRPSRFAFSSPLSAAAAGLTSLLRLLSNAASGSPHGVAHSLGSHPIKDRSSDLTVRNSEPPSTREGSRC